MKIAVLAVSTNIHTIRWVNAIADRGVEVVLLTQQRPRTFDFHPSVTISLLPFRGRFAYALNAPMLRILFKRSGADLLHVQYAGGYGVMSFLAGVERRLVSVWGGDVYVVPYRTPLHGLFIVAALQGARRITSTSWVMAQQVRRLGVTRPIDVIPFGVDTKLFQPAPQPGATHRLVVGTVKTLQPKYGIDTLIRGFVAALADPAFASLDPVLRIAGTGYEKARYEALAEAIGRGRVHFEGHVEHAQVPAMLQTFDIYVAVSREDSESFGVAIIEASACGVPVIVSNVGGLPEVVADGESGLIIPRDAPMCLARALIRLAADPTLRGRLGSAGRKKVMHEYEWDRCVDQMIATYADVIDEEDARPRGVMCRLPEQTNGCSSFASMRGFTDLEEIRGRSQEARPTRRQGMGREDTMVTAQGVSLETAATATREQTRRREKPGRAEFNTAAHGLRGVAALMVFAGHLLGGTARHIYKDDPAYAQAVEAPWHLGTAGVVLFFVISGFVILPSVVRYSPGDFALRRFMRLYPLFLVLSLVFVTLNFFTHAYPKLNDPLTIFAGLTFTNLFFGTEQLTPNAWSLTFETIFYALICLVVYFAVHRPNRLALLVASAVSLAFLVYFPIACFFVGGVAIRIAHDRGWSLPKAPSRLLELTALACFMRFASMSWFAYVPADFTNPIALAILGSSLGYFAFAISPHSLTAAVLRGKLALYLGTVSYSLYLVHPYTYYVTRKLFDRAGLFTDHQVASVALFYAVATPLTLAATHLVHKTVEMKPYQWMFHQRIYRNKTGSRQSSVQ